MEREQVRKALASAVRAAFAAGWSWAEVLEVVVEARPAAEDGRTYYQRLLDERRDGSW